ncbi:MAG: hypothetical protein JSU98_11155 [Gemmatimonadales bacterium]|nr:MAG: hypothetical protein JSU98_11155 [Gemmatimonadales bacterium]
MRPSVLTIALLLAAGTPVGAQSTEDPFPPGGDVESQVPDSALVREVSPLGAFLRALALPSWGHSAVGSHRRGAFYLAAEGGTAWMILRTIGRKTAALRVLEAREGVVRNQLYLESPPDPEETPEEFEARVEAAIEADPRAADARARLEAREGQVEDWVAMGIFLTFLSGADAFVTAHLRDFPDPVDVVVSPTPGGNGVQVGARIYPGAIFR